MKKKRPEINFFFLMHQRGEARVEQFSNGTSFSTLCCSESGTKGRVLTQFQSLIMYNLPLQV